MTLYRLEQYKKSLSQFVSSVVNITNLKGSSVFITGATGLIGSGIVDLFLFLNETAEYDIAVYVGARSEKSVFERFGEQPNLFVVSYDSTKEFTFDVSVDYIIHAASPASPELYMTYPVETMMSNFNGMYQLLEYASRHSVRKILYVSSSEVYGKNNSSEPYAENNYGEMNILDVRSSYGSSKRATETLCVSYASEYDLDVVIARPGHIYGPSAKRSDQRISSDFSWKGALGEDLVMRSEGEQLRSYCYHLDCATAILSVLLAGESGQAYNISNKDSILTIREMAEMISEVAAVNLLVEIPDEQSHQDNPMENSSLDSAKLENLGWIGNFDAYKGFSETIKLMREINDVGKENFDYDDYL